MPTLTTLGLFFATVIVLMLSPGPNMLFLLSQGVAGGFRAAASVAVGIVLADLVMTALTATGVTAVVAAWPPSFDILRYAGALYLLVMAVQGLRASFRHTAMGSDAGGAEPSATPTAVGAARQPALTPIIRMGMLNSLLNPKALLFFLVFLPQFVDPQQGPIGAQLLVLGLMLTVIALAFHLMLAWCSGAIGGWLQRHPRAAVLQDRISAVVLIALALRLLLLEPPQRAA